MNVGMDDHNTAVDRMEEALEIPGFDLGNMAPAGPEVNGSSDNSDLHKEVHVSGDNISLYVEFRSPDCETMHETADEVESPEEAGDAKNVVANDNEECKFAAGDVVWVKTKTKTKIWWPGMIHDPSDASKYGVKSGPDGCLLVRYLANSHVSWYHSSQLKPFYENFMQMSRQNKSRGFVAAVERAVDEFGMWFKSRLSSFSLLANGQSSSNGEKSINASLIGDFGEISATLLNSRDLVSHLKNLSLAASKPRVLEPTILRSYLSAFYCSLGHVNLPMNILCPMANAEVAASGSGKDLSVSLKNLSGNKIGSGKGVEKICNGEVIAERSKRESKSRNKKRATYSIVRNGSDDKVEDLDAPTAGEEGSGSGLNEKGSDLRARKKSRYLSYPYINLEGKESPIKVDDNLVGSASVAKHSSKFQQKWLKVLSDVSVEELSSISSIGLLLGLRIAASGCSCPGENENLEKIKGFFYRFRSFSFHGDRSIDEMYSKILVCEKEKNKKAAEPEEGRKEDFGRKNSETPFTTPGDNGRKSELTTPFSILPGVNIGLTTPLHLPVKESHGLPDLNGSVNFAVGSDFSGKSVLPVLVGFAEGGPKKKRKRRKKEPAELRKAAEFPAPIPDLNGTQTSANSSGKETQEPSPVPADVAPRRRRRKTRGTPIILTFSHGNPPPPKEVLQAEFSKFGTLKEVVAPSPEDPNVARVVFDRKSDAKKAHRSLGKGFLFGGALVKFEFTHSMALQNLSMRTASFTNGGLINPYLKTQISADRTGNPLVPAPAPVPVPVPVPIPARAPVPVPGHSPAPPLDHIKQNLELMTSMLKQSGDNLSPETKAKLELEIKGLLSKVSTMVSSSPSS